MQIAYFFFSFLFIYLVSFVLINLVTCLRPYFHVTSFVAPYNFSDDFIE